MVEHRGCAYHSRERGEPLLGTASTVDRWLLVEQPGPWGYDAVTDSDLSSRVARGLLRMTKAVGARPLLIRRPDPRPSGVRQAFLVSTVPEDRRAERVTFEDPAELLDLDLRGFRSGRRVGEEVTGPLVLVCTNGSHDSCCAVEGRPVAAAAATILGDAVWECSHVGGDRFAANVVWLPAGVYYGRVLPGEVAALAEGIGSGRLSLAHYRGRVPLPFAVQAAETILRRKLGLDGLDDVTVIDHHALDAAGVEVVLDTPEERWRVVVEVGREREAHRLTCRATSPGRPPVYRLVEMVAD